MWRQRNRRKRKAQIERMTGRKSDRRGSRQEIAKAAGQNGTGLEQTEESSERESYRAGKFKTGKRKIWKRKI